MSCDLINKLWAILDCQCFQRVFVAIWAHNLQVLHRSILCGQAFRISNLWFDFKRSLIIKQIKRKSINQKASKKECMQCPTLYAPWAGIATRSSSMYCHGTSLYLSRACHSLSGYFRLYAHPRFGCLRNYMSTRTRTIHCVLQTSGFSSKMIVIPL